MSIINSINNGKKYRKCQKMVKIAMADLKSKFYDPSTISLRMVKVTNEDSVESTTRKVQIVFDGILKKRSEDSTEVWNEREEYIFDWNESEKNANGSMVSFDDREEMGEIIRSSKKLIPKIKKGEVKVQVHDDAGCVFYDNYKKFSDNWCQIHRQIDYADDLLSKYFDFDIYFLTRKQMDKIQKKVFA